MMFEFSDGFPPLEKILIVVFRNHNLQVNLSIQKKLHDPNTGSVLKNNDSQNFQYQLSHPKGIGVIQRFSSRYRPIGLTQMDFEGRNLVYLSTSSESSDMMNIVSEALVKLGGIESNY